MNQPLLVQSVLLTWTSEINKNRGSNKSPVACCIACGQLVHSNSKQRNQADFVADALSHIVQYAGHSVRKLSFWLVRLLAFLHGDSDDINATSFFAFLLEIPTDGSPKWPANTSQASALLLVGSPYSILPFSALSFHRDIFHGLYGCLSTKLTQKYLVYPEQLQGSENILSSM